MIRELTARTLVLSSSQQPCAPRWTPDGCPPRQRSAIRVPSGVSRVQPAQGARLNDAIYRQDVRGGAGVDVEPVPGAPYGVERGDHLFLKPADDFVFFPALAVAILDPLDIRHNDPAGICR